MKDENYNAKFMYAFYMPQRCLSAGLARPPGTLFRVSRYVSPGRVLPTLMTFCSGLPFLASCGVPCPRVAAPASEHDDYGIGGVLAGTGLTVRKLGTYSLPAGLCYRSFTLILACFHHKRAPGGSML